MQRGHQALIIAALWALLLLLIAVAVYGPAPPPSAGRQLRGDAGGGALGGCSDPSPGPLLPTIVVVSASPHMSADDVLMAARSVVLHSPPQVLARLVLLDAGGSVQPFGPDVAALREALGGAVPVDVVGPSAGPAAAAADETAFRALLEPRLRTWCGDKAHAVVYLDAACAAQPGWLAPLVGAVSRDPFVLAVPEVRDVGSPAAAASLAAAGGSFDWQLNYHPPAGGAAGAAGAAAPVGAATLAAFAVHSDWWAALGGHSAAAAAGLATGLWPSDLPGGGGGGGASSSAAASLSDALAVPGAGAAALELSLRAWACGGEVLLVSCSSVQRQVFCGPVSQHSHAWARAGPAPHWT